MKKEKESDIRRRSVHCARTIWIYLLNDLMALDKRWQKIHRKFSIVRVASTGNGFYVCTYHIHIYLTYDVHRHVPALERSFFDASSAFRLALAPKNLNPEPDFNLVRIMKLWNEQIASINNLIKCANLDVVNAPGPNAIAAVVLCFAAVSCF